jgi:hypothetical protein
MPQLFRPSRSNVTCTGIFILPGAILFTVLGANALLRGAAAPAPIGAAFLSSGILFFLFFAHHASIVVEVTSSEIIRRNIFGSKSFRLIDVASAVFSSVRGIVFLTIRTSVKREWMQLSTYTFSRDQLQQIQALLKAQAQTSSRPFQAAASMPTPKEWVGIIAVELVLMFSVFAIIVVAAVSHLRASGVSDQPVISHER